jgi:hypothetical protein
MHNLYAYVCIFSVFYICLEAVHLLLSTALTVKIVNMQKCYDTPLQLLYTNKKIKKRKS